MKKYRQKNTDTPFGVSVFFCLYLFPAKEVTQWHGRKGHDDTEDDNKGDELLDFHFLHKIKRLLSNRKVWGIFFVIKGHFLAIAIDDDGLLSLISFFDGVDVASEILDRVLEGHKEDAGRKDFDFSPVKIIPLLSVSETDSEMEFIEGMSIKYIFSC